MIRIVNEDSRCREIVYISRVPLFSLGAMFMLTVLELATIETSSEVGLIRVTKCEFS